MKIDHIASGSTANCFRIRTKHDDIVIDAGVPGIDCEGFLLTHTHSDHFENIYEYLKKCKWFHTHEDVLKHAKRKRPDLAELMDEKWDEPFTVLSFPVKHDIPCAAFVILGEESYCHITDTGTFDPPEEMKNCTHYSIEANWDEEMIDLCDRHDFVTDRAKIYHLSNIQAIELADRLRGEDTKTVRFIHMSQGTNAPSIAEMEHDLWLQGREFPKRIYEEESR